MFEYIVILLLVVTVVALSVIINKKKYCPAAAPACPACPAAAPAASLSCANLGISVDMNSRFGSNYAQLQRIISSIQKSVCSSYNTDAFIQKLQTAIDSKPDAISCKDFKDKLSKSLEESSNSVKNLDSQNEEAIKLLNDLILSLANELCKNGDDSADAATQLKNIIKDLLNSLCPMNEIEKFNPVYISSKSDSYKNITSVVKSPI